MRKLIFIAAALILVFASAGAASRTTERIQVVYQGSPANYQLYVFGGQSLRCLAGNLHISRDERGDGDGPIIIECR